MTVVEKSKITEIRICPSVLCGQNDCILTVSLGPTSSIDKKSLKFQGLYLSMDATNVVKPEELNSKQSMHLDSFNDGLLYITVVRYFEQDGEQYAIVRICSNVQQMKRKVEKICSNKTPVLALQYHWQSI